MIGVKLELRFRRDAQVVILPNATPGVIDGLDNLMTSRPLEALRVGNVLQDCELVDRASGDRFTLPADIRWRVQELSVDPPHVHRPDRVYTLVRVVP